MTSHGECTEAHLGLATTKQLIDELAARAELALAVGDKWPLNSFSMEDISNRETLLHYSSLLEEANGESAPLLEPTCSCPEGPMVEWIRTIPTSYINPQYEHQPRCKRCLLLIDPIF